MMDGEGTIKTNLNQESTNDLPEVLKMSINASDRKNDSLSTILLRLLSLL
jgi:hypothetical protein